MASLGKLMAQGNVALVGVVLLGLAMNGCGQMNTRERSPSESSNAALTSAMVASGSGAVPDSRRFRGDEDDDDAGLRQSGDAPLDSDQDQDNDVRDNVGKGYYDGDDSVVRNDGHAASESDRQAVTVLVERYRAAAVADDGVTACSLTYAVRANSYAEDYGPTYLPGAKTCAPVLTVIFKQFHSQLAQPAEVTAVRVKGDRANALLGSPMAPASAIDARRERGTWKIDRAIPAPLP